MKNEYNKPTLAVVKMETEAPIAASILTVVLDHNGGTFVNDL